MTDFNLEKADKEVFSRLNSTGRISNDLRRAMTQQFNRCNVCGHTISYGRPAFAGYTAASLPRVVCAECADCLKELATPIYWSGTFDLSVEEDRALWRYMDFSKFVAMMQQSGIYFTRASNFDDPFEAAAGIASRESEWDAHYSDFLRKAVTIPPPGYASRSMTKLEVDREVLRLLTEIKSAYASSRNLLVCCWHLNSVESEALWRIYCSAGAPGVAIKTNVVRLWNALEREVGVNVGKVQYIDFKKSFASGDQRIFCKRSSLGHENEVRAVLPNVKSDPFAGRLVHCDLNALVEGVVISPYAPDWFRQTVEATVSKFGYDFQVKASEIIEAPFY